MAQITYSPGCSVAWAGDGGTAVPALLSKVLHADTIISIAPSVGTANLIVADPDGTLAATIKPNDTVHVVFTSRARKAVNLGLLYPGPPSAWYGMVNSILPAYDPRTQYGRAVKINAWTLWKPLVATSVPLEFFFSGQYPVPDTTLANLLKQAVASCNANMGIRMQVDFSESSVPLQLASNVMPTDMDINDPQAQSWAALLMPMLTAAGTESYAREDGTLIVRDFQGMQNPDLRALLTIPTGELFESSGGGVSDLGLTTNVIVSWSTAAQSSFAAVAPNNGLADIGPLPPQLLGTDGKPLPHLGKRFASYTADFLSSLQDAERYATNQRSVGMAGVDTFQAEMALNGDIRIGTHVLVPCYDRRYYVTTVGHYFESQVDASTTVSGNFGVPTHYLWNQAAMQGASQIPWPLAPPAPSPTTRPANLAPPVNANDPDVRWLANMTVISVTDIATTLRNSGSPFADQATHIWTAAQQAGIRPAFALAVWQEECGLGANTAAVTDIANHNPGSIGVTSTAGGGAYYATWADGIDAWFSLVAGPGYLGAGLFTVSAIAAVYDPANATSWAANVTQIMLALIGTATVPTVTPPSGVGPPKATGTMGAVAAYAASLAASIPKRGGVYNGLVSGTPLGDFASKAGYGDIECTTFVEYLMAMVGGIAGIVNTTTGAIANGPNAAQWGGYLGGLGFADMTGDGPLPGDVLLFQPGELDPKTGLPRDLSDGDGHVGIIVGVNQPDSRGDGGTVTVASANCPTPTAVWTLTNTGAYGIGPRADGSFFGATPFAWYRHS